MPEQRATLFRGAVQPAVAHIEATIPTKAACPECGGALVMNGRLPLVLETLVGRLEYARQRLRCPRCALDVNPLDGALGLLPGTGSTLGPRERALWAAIELSYAKAAAFLAEFTGLAVSHGSRGVGSVLAAPQPTLRPAGCLKRTPLRRAARPAVGRGRYGGRAHHRLLDASAVLL